MLASEIIFQTLDMAFDGRVGPHPLPEPFEHQNKAYVTYRKVSTESLDTVEGWSGHDRVRMQVMVVHADNIQCERYAAQVRWMMDQQNFCECVVAGSYSDFDSETQLYYEMIDFMMWQNAC